MAMEDFSRPSGCLFVTHEIRRNEDRFWAQPFSTDCWHCRAHTELPRLIRSGAYNRPVAFPSDNNRFAAQMRIVALFDRSVERVHVHMNELSLYCLFDHL